MTDRLQEACRKGEERRLVAQLATTAVQRGDLAINVRDYGAAGDGVTDDTAAFHRALAAGRHVFAPEGDYLVTGVTVPDRTTLTGVRTRTYTDDPTTGTRIRSTNPAQTAAVVSLAYGASLVGVSVIGAGMRSTTAHAAVEVAGGNRIESCHIGRGRVGIDGMYSGGVVVAGCVIFSNASHGVRNLVDSRVIDNTLNANGGAGISMGDGANDVIIGHNKIEWNNGAGFQTFSSTSNVLTGNIIDRNGGPGVLVRYSQITVSGNRLRRNGRLSSADMARDAHFYLEGASGSIVGNTTAHGAGDTGLGYDSPLSSIVEQGCAGLSVVGNTLGGCTGEPRTVLAEGVDVTLVGNSGITPD